MYLHRYKLQPRDVDALPLRVARWLDVIVTTVEAIEKGH
jgi:hypothetical protein